MKTESEYRQDIVEVGRRIWLRGFVAANDGNLSIRISENEVLATPTGVSKGFLTSDQIVKVDMEGNQMEGHLKASSEIAMHLEMYRQRCDVCAVVHAHPPVATGFAVAGIPLDRPVLPEVVISLGGIPLTPYAKPGTWELPEVIKPYLANHDAFLLANHGALTLGADIYQAYYRMETLEHFAKISLVARQLGQENVLEPEAIEHLESVREQMGLTFPRACRQCGACELGGGVRTPTPERLAEATGGNGFEELDEATLTEIIKRVAQRVIAQVG